MTNRKKLSKKEFRLLCIKLENDPNLSSKDWFIDLQNRVLTVNNTRTYHF